MAKIGKILKYSFYNGKGTYLDIKTLDEIPFTYKQFVDGNAIPVGSKVIIQNNKIYKYVPWWKKIFGGK